MKERFFISCEREVKHYEGLEIREGASCIVRLSNMHLQFCDAKRRPMMNISLKNISNIGVISDKELVEKDRNVIGRGLVGGALFGTGGLILGGLSGVSKKQVMQNIDYLIINYKENGEDKVISIYAKEGIFDKVFMKKVNESINNLNREIKCPSCNNLIEDISCLKCPNCGKKLKNMAPINILIAICILLIVAVAVIRIVFVGSVEDIDIIKRVVNVDDEKAEKIDEILEHIGIEKIEDMVADSDGLDGFEGVGSKGYRVKTNFSNNVILYLDSENNVICIRYASEDYYRNGKVIKIFE